MIMCRNGAESGKEKPLCEKATHTDSAAWKRIGSGSLAQTESNGMA